MTVKEFLEDLNKVTGNSIKEERMKKNLNVKQYVSFIDKVNLAERVVYHSTHDFDQEGNVVGNITINSISKYLLHVMGIIDMYTDLDINYNNLVEDYDLLNVNGMIQEIVTLIGEKEIAECQMLLDMKLGDFMQNKLSVYSFVRDQVERFGTLSGITLSSIKEGFANVVDSLTPEQIEQFANSFVNNTTNEDVVRDAE